MTAQAAQLPASAGAAITPISGAGLGTDTYPPCVLLARNTGAGTHIVTWGVNATFDGMPVNAGVRTLSMPTLTDAVIRLPASYADVNGRIAVSVDGTAADVKFYPLGA